MKRGRSPYRSNTAFDSVYAACSKRNNPNKLCEVCAAPLESDSKGPQKRIFCAVCRIGKPPTLKSVLFEACVNVETPAKLPVAFDVASTAGIANIYTKHYLRSTKQGAVALGI